MPSDAIERLSDAIYEETDVRLFTDDRDHVAALQRILAAVVEGETPVYQAGDSNRLHLRHGDAVNHARHRYAASPVRSGRIVWDDATPK